MEIKTVSIIGLGALGILFGNQMSKKMPKENLRVIASESRINKYTSNGLYCNGELCSFNYKKPEEICSPADLLIFAVKFGDLNKAIKDVRNHVGEDTIIISLLNGIASEEIISETYGSNKMLYCIAQGMDAVKENNKLFYKNMGVLCIGEKDTEMITPKLESVINFFEKTNIPYEIEGNIIKRLWGKFMANVGINQTIAMYKRNYGVIQIEGEARKMMIDAMREVITLSEKEGINLTEEDLTYWLNIIGSLNPEGKPSMRQDMEAKRFSEVDSFAGAVLKLAKKHNMSAPVNQKLYDWIKETESLY